MTQLSKQLSQKVSETASLLEKSGQDFSEVEGFDLFAVSKSETMANEAKFFKFALFEQEGKNYIIWQKKET